ncbi:MAG: hypothetical protein KTR31_09470 [Myxococcales bacterium]|nr:hypothetical protein [Myxococcales bacterium]
MVWLTMGTATMTMAGPPVVAEMHERYQLLAEARDATIAGDLERTREAARQLADLDEPVRLPKSWRPWVERVDAHATALSMAPDLVVASIQVGHLASACGGCHEVARGGPQVSDLQDVPVQQWTEGANMGLHAWAVEWMWLGLVTRDDVAWTRGAQELSSRPLPMLFDGTPEWPQPQLEQLVYLLAERAEEASEVEKATLMGQLVATCAECHVRSGR